MNGGGDVLARGGRTAQFGGPSGVSQKRWDDIWKDYEPEVEYEIKETVDPSELLRLSLPKLKKG